MEQSDLFGKEKVSKILFRLAPPVMLSQLIQALYNIIDSLFVGVIFCRQFLKKDYVKADGGLETAGALNGAGGTDNIAAADKNAAALKPSKPGVIITIAREHGSQGKQIGRVAAEKLGIPFYYKEMVAFAANESGLDRDFISGIYKNSPDALRELYLSSHTVQRAIKAQELIIRRNCR